MITAAVDQLVADLEGTGYPVETAVPHELVAGEGLIVLVPGEDYVTPADTFAAEYVVNLEAHLLVDLVDNAAAAEDLDRLIAAVVDAVDGGLWSLGTMRRPGPLTANEWLAHGTTLPLSVITTLTPQE